MTVLGGIWLVFSRHFVIRSYCFSLQSNSLNSKGSQQMKSISFASKREPSMSSDELDDATSDSDDIRKKTANRVVTFILIFGFS